MVPTPAAERLAGGIGRGLDVLQNAVAEFAQAPERDPLVISLDPQFANRWLPSRLGRLLADPAGANLEIRVEERRADFVTDGVDLGVRYGAGVWEGVETRRLFRETLFPVCSPMFARTHPVSRPEDLVTAPLIHHGHRPWRLWFEAFGLPTPPQQGLAFDDSVMLLEAAAQGLGFALARSGLMEPYFETGRLVRPLKDDIASDLGFFVVWRADSRKLARIAALRDWLVVEAGEAATQAEDV
jgi:LysR family glycine cleavage system transcriptional activator